MKIRTNNPKIIKFGQNYIALQEQWKYNDKDFSLVTSGQTGEKIYKTKRSVLK